MKSLKPLMLELAHASEKKELADLRDEILEFIESVRYVDSSDINAFYNTINIGLWGISDQASRIGKKATADITITWESATAWNKGVFTFLEQTLPSDDQRRFVDIYKDTPFYTEEIQAWKQGRY